MALLHVLHKNAGNGFPEICLMKMRNILTLTGSYEECCYREFHPPLLGFLLVVCMPPLAGKHFCDFLSSTDVPNVLDMDFTLGPWECSGNSSVLWRENEKTLLPVIVVVCKARMSQQRKVHLLVWCSLCFWLYFWIPWKTFLEEIQELHGKKKSFGIIFSGNPLMITLCLYLKFLFPDRCSLC